MRSSVKAGKIGKSVFLMPRRDEDRKTSREVTLFTLPRKAAIAPRIPVPQTDTGRQEENSKTRGRTFVKELGKMTP